MLLIQHNVAMAMPDPGSVKLPRPLMGSHQPPQTQAGKQLLDGAEAFCVCIVNCCDWLHTGVLLYYFYQYRLHEGEGPYVMQLLLLLSQHH